MRTTEPGRGPIRSSSPGPGSPATALAAVVGALTRAADRALTQPGPTTAVVGVGAQLAAARATDLLDVLPPAAPDQDQDPFRAWGTAAPDDGPGDNRTSRTWQVTDLLEAAHRALMAHPIEAFPVGAGEVVLAVADLLRLSRGQHDG